MRPATSGRSTASGASAMRGSVSSTPKIFSSAAIAAWKVLYSCESCWMGSKNDDRYPMKATITPTLRSSSSTRLPPYHRISAVPRAASSSTPGKYAPLTVIVLMLARRYSVLASRKRLRASSSRPCACTTRMPDRFSCSTDSTTATRSRVSRYARVARTRNHQVPTASSGKIRNAASASFQS